MKRNDSCEFATTSSSSSLFFFFFSLARFACSSLISLRFFGFHVEKVCASRDDDDDGDCDGGGGDGGFAAADSVDCPIVTQINDISAAATNIFLLPLLFFFFFSWFLPTNHKGVAICTRVRYHSREIQDMFSPWTESQDTLTCTQPVRKWSIACSR